MLGIEAAMARRIRRTTDDADLKPKRRARHDQPEDEGQNERDGDARCTVVPGNRIGIV